MHFLPTSIILKKVRVEVDLSDHQAVSAKSYLLTFECSK
jgi:hypothetical protein